MSQAQITDHPYQGEFRAGASCQYMYEAQGNEQKDTTCGQQAMVHEVKWKPDFLLSNPHDYVDRGDGTCGYRGDIGGTVVCGYPGLLHQWAEEDRRKAARSSVGALVRKADAAQYERPPMPDAARKGPVVTLIDAPVDPLGTLAVIGGIYTGQIARSKAEVTDEQRRQMLADMQSTVLDGPLEAIQFTFLVEGISRSITHQLVRNRFAFVAQESLRFAVAEDWAQEVPLPPSLLSAASTENAAMAGVWRKALNAAEDSYNALIGAGMPAEEARGVLPHDITTRLYWTISLRTLLQEAGKRTCTQAQFPWRVIFAGVAKALRERGVEYSVAGGETDAWQYQAFADLMRPVCYQTGSCGFMAKFDRGCTIRSRVDAFAREGIGSEHWARTNKMMPQDPEDGGEPRLWRIDPAEWAADPGAARS